MMLLSIRTFCKSLGRSETILFSIVSGSSRSTHVIWLSPVDWLTHVAQQHLRKPRRQPVNLWFRWSSTYLMFLHFRRESLIWIAHCRFLLTDHSCSKARERLFIYQVSIRAIRIRVLQMSTDRWSVDHVCSSSDAEGSAQIQTNGLVRVNDRALSCLHQGFAEENCKTLPRLIK